MDVQFEITIYHNGIKRMMKVRRIWLGAGQFPFFRVTGKTGDRDFVRLGRTWFQIYGEDVGRDVVQQIGYAITQAEKAGLVTIDSRYT